MRSFVIYNSDGKILRSGQVDDDTSQIQDAATEFELLVDVPENIEDYVVSAGALVLKPQSEIDAVKAETDWRILRGERNALLAATDWTQAVDAPLTDAKKAEWAAYRSALRSMPDNTTDPANPTWPSKPS